MFPSLIGSLKTLMSMNTSRLTINVSIPHRKFKNELAQDRQGKYYHVSIPHRKFKNQAWFSLRLRE